VKNRQQEAQAVREGIQFGAHGIQEGMRVTLETLQAVSRALDASIKGTHQLNQQVARVSLAAEQLGAKHADPALQKAAQKALETALTQLQTQNSQLQKTFSQAKKGVEQAQDSLPRPGRR